MTASAIVIALLENEEYIHLINLNKCSKDVTCKYDPDNQPIMYARGFRKLSETNVSGPVSEVHESADCHIWQKTIFRTQKRKKNKR